MKFGKLSWIQQGEKYSLRGGGGGNPPLAGKIAEWCDKLIAGGTGVNDEDFFVKERDWAALYHIHINDTRDKYQQVVSAKLKTSNQITHLSTLLKASVGGREGKFKTSESH